MTNEDKQEAKLGTLNVYQAITAVQGAVAKTGIAKDRKNEQQKYKFRGIDDVFNALAPLLAETGLCILPFVETREVTERTSVKTDDRGNARTSVLFYVAVRVRFDFVSAADGSRHQVVTYGEAMDSGDKATNKAMSAAYKYACLQTFCIPTEGDNDPDGSTHEVAAKDALFPTPNIRAEFVANCIDAITKTKNIIDLRTQRECNLAKWNAMKASSDLADVEAFNKIVAVYNPAFAMFKELAAKAADQKPQTVEAAKQHKAPLLDDEIPF